MNIMLSLVPACHRVDRIPLSKGKKTLFFQDIRMEDAKSRLIGYMPGKPTLPGRRLIDGWVELPTKARCKEGEVPKIRTYFKYGWGSSL